MKKCSGCTLDKPLSLFGKDKRRKDNVALYCRDCRKLQHRAYYDANIEKERARSAAKNSAQYVKYGAERFRQYRMSNPSSYKRANKKWIETHRGHKNSLGMKRHAAKLQRTPKWLTQEQLAEIKHFYVLAQEFSWLNEDGKVFDVDHIVPLQGENVSGLHVPWNLQLLPKRLNCQKYNNF